MEFGGGDKKEGEIRGDGGDTGVVGRRGSRRSRDQPLEVGGSCWPKGQSL